MQIGRSNILTTAGIVLLPISLILLWQSLLNSVDYHYEDQSEAIMFFWTSLASIVVGSLLLLSKSPEWLKMTFWSVSSFELLLASFWLTFADQWFYGFPPYLTATVAVLTVVVSLIALIRGTAYRRLVVFSLTGGIILSLFSWLAANCC